MGVPEPAPSDGGKPELPSKAASVEGDKQDPPVENGTHAGSQDPGKNELQSKDVAPEEKHQELVENGAAVEGSQEPRLKEKLSFKDEERVGKEDWPIENKAEKKQQVPLESPSGNGVDGKHENLSESEAKEDELSENGPEGKQDCDSKDEADECRGLENANEARKALPLDSKPQQDLTPGGETEDSAERPALGKGESKEEDENGDEELSEEQRKQAKTLEDALNEAKAKMEAASLALKDAQKEKEKVEADAKARKDALHQVKAKREATNIHFRRIFEKQMVPPEAINISWTEFPYFLSESTRELLVDAATPYLRQMNGANDISGLPFSSRMILIDGPANTELYQETLAKALARDQNARFLALDSTDLAPQDFGDDMSDLESSSGEENLDNMPKGILDTSEEKKDSSPSKGQDPPSKPKYVPKKGDRVKYVEGEVSKDDKNSSQLQKEVQRGRVVHVSKQLPGKAAVVFEDSPANSGHRAEGVVNWCSFSKLEKDEEPLDTFTDEWFAAIEALCEIEKPVVVYLPDPQNWLKRAVPSARRQDFLDRFQEKINHLNKAVVFIAGRSSKKDKEEDDESHFMQRMFFFGNRKRNPKRSKVVKPKDVYKLFTNIIKVSPPKDEAEIRQWKKQLQNDKDKIYAKKNIQQLQKMLALHNIICPELSTVNIPDFLLTDLDAEKVIGWSNSHYIGSHNSDHKTDQPKLSTSSKSLERAVCKLREQEDKKDKKSNNFEGLADNDYERRLLSAVIPAEEVGVQFDKIGSLDDVKASLEELITIPIQRPELFKRGNLTSPCKGVLLFGPPGTGKTLLAKAVATEAGANFMSISTATITSKWYGEAEKLAKAVFTLAKKLAPVVIFVDEVDSILGARGGCNEHEATRRVKNEFMAGWDGLLSKSSDQVMVLAATNRPFDLDDAVIRRMPRRLLVDLPNVEGREKILRVVLAEEELEESFDFAALARETEGYSGSDLKNLCVAAAFQPIRDLRDLEKKAKAEGCDELANKAVLRPLKIDDFLDAREMVGASVAYNAASIIRLQEWNNQFGSRAW